jgi:hypothetical protein
MYQPDPETKEIFSSGSSAAMSGRHDRISGRGKVARSSFTRSVSSFRLMPDGEGDLKVIFLDYLTQPRNPEICRYIFWLISREGVKSINSNPIRND